LLARDYQPKGRFPVIDQGQKDIAGWSDDESLVIESGFPYVVFGDHSRTFKYVDQPFVLGADGTQLLKPAAEYNARFFYYACLQLDLPSRGYNRHFTFLKEKALPLPPKQEQEKIAAVLWKLQRAVATQDRLIVATRDLKQSAMARLFTNGLRGERLKETPIGSMPESWSPRSLKDLCEIWSGGTPRKSVAEYWKGDIPWVSGKDLKTPALDDAIDHVSAEGITAGSRLAPKDSVLILVRGMGLAKDLPVAVINRPMAFNQDVKALVSRGQHSGKFLRSAIYVGKARLLSQMVPSAHGTMTLNLDDIENFEIACPSDSKEGETIATALTTIDHKLAHHQKTRAALNDLFQTMLHKLMTGEIRVADLDIDTSEIVAPVGALA
jgi:type I restriction enzyme S subunit